MVDGEIEDGMLGNESLFALRTVFGGDIHLAPTLKLVEQQQVACRACAKQESHLFAEFREPFAQLEQWSDEQLKPLPSGITRLSVSPTRVAKSDAVPSPALRMSSQS